MTHYRMSYNLPSASILSRNQLSSSFDESRIYNEDTVFMENKQEFSIKLFNPLRKKLGVQIGLNGENSKHLVILRPGEDVTLDRFIDNNSKMLFETYEYDASNPSASNAVANNGIVDVRFFNEKEMNDAIFTTSTFNMNCNTTGGSATLDVFTTFDQENKNSRGYSTLTNTNGMGSIINTNSSNLRETKSKKSLSRSASAKKWSPITEPVKDTLKETGMVSKGDTSDQQFEQVNAQFETAPFHVLKFFIKPNSEKPYESTEIREYCTQCSYRIRNKKWNFCPKCGSDV